MYSNDNDQLLFKGWRRMKNVLLSILLFLFSFQVFAIVDYSDPAPETIKNQKIAPKSFTKVENNGLSKSDFSFNSGYEFSQVNSEKVNALNFDLHLQTPYNVFFDGSYWQADYQAKSQAGNPKLILGFNWLKIGNPSDEARLNLMGGMKLASQSDLGTSRTDKIFAVETTKRFMNFGVGLGYEISVVGEPTNKLETSIGNIQRISVSVGWMVSNDIQFELEAENFNISEASDTTRTSYLKSPLHFSTFSPKINLGLASFVNFVLGAHFQMQKAPETTAKIFDLHGADSSSVFMGLSFNL